MSQDRPPPRIHTLRDGANTPATSDCFTPRTLTGNAAAFKDASYGNSMYGPYRRRMAWVGKAAWVAAGVLLLLSLMLIYGR